MAIGDSGVGKTTLFQKYTIGDPSDAIVVMGIDFYFKKIKISNKKYKLQLWNVSGDEKFKFILPSYIWGASGAFIVFDITNISTFENVYNWVDSMKNERKNSLSMILIGNKIDLEHKREVKIEQVKEACNKLGLSRYIECSFLTGKNVKVIFDIMIEDLIQKISQS